MIIKGDKESIKKYLIKNKKEIDIIDCKLGGETRINDKGTIIEKETEIRVVSKDIDKLHSELSLKIFRSFGI